MCGGWTETPRSGRKEAALKIGSVVWLLVGLFANSLWAQGEWVRIAPAVSGLVFVAPESLQRDGHLTGAKLKRVLPGGAFRIEEVRVDCGRSSIRVIRSEFHPWDRRAEQPGGVQIDSMAGEWRQYPPRSDGALITTGLCEYAQDE